MDNESAAISCDALTQKKCVPCEGGVPKFTTQDAEKLLLGLPGWTITHNGERIRKEWRVKHFKAGMNFLNLVCDLAEEEAHHPDVSISGYRNLTIEIWTHAIGGLSENDFILAAKIDQLPIELAK